MRYLIKLGKMDQNVVMYMEYVDLSEIFGWTPAQIDAQDPLMLMIYKAILSGRKHNPAQPRQETRQLKGMGMI